MVPLLGPKVVPWPATLVVLVQTDLAAIRPVMSSRRQNQRQISLRLCHGERLIWDLFDLCCNTSLPPLSLLAQEPWPP